jgi:hypothetical protein
MSRFKNACFTAWMILAVCGVFARAAEKQNGPSTEPRFWKTFRSDTLGFEVQYPNFGTKTRAVPVLADVPGYSFEYWSNERQAYCPLFTVMKSEGLPPDPQGLGREAPVIASQGKWRLTLWLNHEDACSDLVPIMDWVNAHSLEGRFIHRSI